VTTTHGQLQDFMTYSIADDTCLIVEASSIKELNYSLNAQVEKARI